MVRFVHAPPPRTRAVVEAELASAATHRDHAARRMDFDAYQNLVAQIDDLLLELHAMIPGPREASES